MASLASYTTAASDTCTAPSGLAEGDVLVAIVQWIGEIDTTGWDEIVEAPVSSLMGAALMRVIDTPAAEYTIPVVGDPGSNIVTGTVLMRVTDSGGVVDGTPVTSVGSTGGMGSPMVFDPITTTTDNAIVFAWAVQTNIGDGSVTWGYEPPLEASFFASDMLGRNMTAHYAKAGMGSTGPLTLTTSFVYTGGFAFAISGEGGPTPPAAPARPFPGLLLPV